MDALAAYYPPAGFTHQQVIEVQRQMAWPLALLFVSFPLLNLAPVVLLLGLFRARVIPFWPLPIWIIGVVIFVQLADRNGATHLERLIGLAAFAAAYLGGPGWTGLRYQELGPEGLRERSHRPLVSPNATKAEVVGKILHLRQHYHFGPAKISAQPRSRCTSGATTSSRSARRASGASSSGTLFEPPGST